MLLGAGGIGSIVRQASLTWKRDISKSRTTAVFYLQVTFAVGEDLVVTPGQKISFPLTLDFGDGQLKDMAASVEVCLSIITRVIVSNEFYNFFIG